LGYFFADFVVLCLDALPTIFQKMKTIVLVPFILAAPRRYLEQYKDYAPGYEQAPAYYDQPVQSFDAVQPGYEVEQYSDAPVQRYEKSVLDQELQDYEYPPLQEYQRVPQAQHWGWFNRIFRPKKAAEERQKKLAAKKAKKPKKVEEEEAEEEYTAVEQYADQSYEGNDAQDYTEELAQYQEEFDRLPQSQQWDFFNRIFNRKKYEEDKKKRAAKKAKKAKKPKKVEEEEAEEEYTAVEQYADQSYEGDEYF
jgi:hypothetical protein